MTANAQSAPLNKGDFTKTTLPIGWLLFTLLAIVTMGVRRGGKRSFDPPLEIGTKKENFLASVDSD